MSLDGPRLVRPWLPRIERQKRLWLPESARQRKIVAFKARLDRESDCPWLGGKIRCDRETDIRAPDDTSQSVRDQIHLQLTGLLERYHGEWIYQEGDRMQAITYIEEWPETEDTPERWATFLGREPPKRDSPDD